MTLYQVHNRNENPMRKILSSIVLAATLAAGVGIGGAVANAAGPSEDSKSFNCAKHGNKRCAVQVDLTPNRAGGKVWYVLDFRTHKFTKRSF